MFALRGAVSHQAIQKALPKEGKNHNSHNYWAMKSFSESTEN
jgi:hypothetical protein